MTRLKVFETKTLPPALKRDNVAAFFKANAMEHLHWMAVQINTNKDLVERAELFYEHRAVKVESCVETARRKELALLRTGALTPIDKRLARSVDADKVHEVTQFLSPQ